MSFCATDSVHNGHLNASNLGPMTQVVSDIVVHPLSATITHWHSIIVSVIYLAQKRKGLNSDILDEMQKQWGKCDDKYLLMGRCQVYGLQGMSSPYI